jgi:hypothetical protein
MYELCMLKVQHHIKLLASFGRCHICIIFGFSSALYILKMHTFFTVVPVL